VHTDSHPAVRCERFPSRSPCIRQPRFHSTTQLIISESLLDHRQHSFFEPLASVGCRHDRTTPRDLACSLPLPPDLLLFRRNSLKVSICLLISRSGLHVSQSLYLPPSMRTCTFLPSCTQPSMSKKYQSSSVQHAKVV
jgi:hypothetical protein